MLKRSFLVGCVLLVGCAPKELPNNEVLERATLASQTLASSAFSISMNGTFTALETGQQVTGTFTSEGATDDHGKKMSQHIEADLTWGGVTKPAHVLFAANTSVINSQTFFSIEKIQLEPNSAENMFSFLTPLTGKWWVMPSSVTGSLNIAPDPNVLKAQAQVVRVERDEGIQKTENGYAYHYFVSLDQEKFQRFLKDAGQWDETQLENMKDLKATGELWIDAKTFYLESAVWKIESAPVMDGTLSATITIQLRDHDEAQDITQPESADVFPTEDFSLPGTDDSLEPASESGTLL